MPKKCAYHIQCNLYNGDLKGPRIFLSQLLLKSISIYPVSQISRFRITVVLFIVGPAKRDRNVPFSIYRGENVNKKYIFYNDSTEKQIT